MFAILIKSSLLHSITSEQPLLNTPTVMGAVIFIIFIFPILSDKWNEWKEKDV